MARKDRKVEELNGNYRQKSEKKKNRIQMKWFGTMREEILVPLFGIMFSINIRNLKNEKIGTKNRKENKKTEHRL